MSGRIRKRFTSHEKVALLRLHLSPEVTTMKLFTVLLVALCVSITATASDGPARKLRVVVFGGHPDDPESGAGGLIATLTRQGHEVICAYGTTFRGDRRFFGRPEAEVRQEEATAACKVLGATPKFFPYAHEKLVADEATSKRSRPGSRGEARHRGDSLAARHPPESSRRQFAGLAVLPA